MLYHYIFQYNKAIRKVSEGYEKYDTNNEMSNYGNC